MPSLIDVATARQHIETGLVDAALQRLIDDADALIVERYGAHTAAYNVEVEGGQNVLFLNRPVVSVTSITEYAARTTTPGLVLDPSDYRILYGGRVLERLTSGANPRNEWGERLVLVYTGDPQTARRTRIELDLVRLAARYEPYTMESVGDWSVKRVDDYVAEREKLLAELRAGTGIH